MLYLQETPVILDDSKLLARFPAVRKDAIRRRNPADAGLDALASIDVGVFASYPLYRLPDSTRGPSSAVPRVRYRKMTATAIVLIVIAVIAVAILAWYLVRERRTTRLRSRFGPEYEHAMREFGNRPKAEDALAARQKRMEKIHVHPLSHEERDRFSDQWHDVQARFVDDPSGSIDEADRLVCDVMKSPRLSDDGIRAPRGGSVRGSSARSSQLPRRAPDRIAPPQRGGQHRGPSQGAGLLP